MNLIELWFYFDWGMITEETFNKLWDERIRCINGN